MLEKLGHEVRAVEGGLQAWKVLQERYYPVVITDFQMPELDGMALARHIRAKQQDGYTYILMHSAFDTRENYLDAIVAGVDDFLAKPIDNALLAARLHVAERIIGLRNHVRQLESVMAVCSYCKKVRQGDGWVDMQSYVADRFGTWPSHGICPHCYEHTVKPELAALGVKMDDSESRL
jgi:CheY-like chemotaxis protein